VQDAWARGQELAVHGWIYRLADGLLHDLGLCVLGAEEVDTAYREVLRTTGTPT
jgi:carbonic anhydrase